MPGTTQSCPGGAHPDTSFVLPREYEAGFLLPQFMGALASETSGSGLSDRCQQRSSDGPFARLHASLKRALKLRLLTLK